nr:site-2 protease family protein [Candidatus Freyrarchaeum guaymaensis]
MISEAQLVIILLLAFWSGILIVDRIFNLKKYGLDVFPFLIIYRTEKFNKFISKVAFKSPRLWIALGNIGIPLSYTALGYGVYLLTLNLLNVFVQPQQASPIVPLIPGVTITGLSFLYALLGIMVTLAFHELAHGIMARAENLPVKSSGLLFLLFLPGGFVEIEEDAMVAAHPKTRLRVLSAGSAVNLVTALIALLLLLNFQTVISPWYGPSVGVVVTNVDQNSFAYGRLPPSTIIFAINGTPIWSPSTLDVYLLNVKPFEILKLTTNIGEIETITGINPRAPYRGYIGILYPQPFYIPYPNAWWLSYTLPSQIYLVIQWMFIVAFSVAIINMMPIPAFDGDRMFEEVINYLIPEEKKTKILEKEYPTRKLLLNILRVSAICFLSLNILLPILKVGFTPL